MLFLKIENLQRIKETNKKPIAVFKNRQLKKIEKILTLAIALSSSFWNGFLKIIGFSLPIFHKFSEINSLLLRNAKYCIFFATFVIVW